MANYDAIIVGAGVVGQSLALLLKHTLCQRILLIDKTPLNITPIKSVSGRVSAINLASKELFERIGVWEYIRNCYVFYRIKVWDEAAKASLNFNKTDYRPLGYIIDNEALQIALKSAVKACHIDYIRGDLSDITMIEQGYEVCIDQRKKLDCHLLIGADGKYSKVRQLANINHHSLDYHESAIVASLGAEKSYAHSLYQWFLPDASILAILPFSEKKCALVWSCNNYSAKKLMALNDKEFAELLSKHTKGRFGQLSLLSGRSQFRLFESSAKHYVKAHLALVGDAAHSIHPLAGQGANLGLMDVKVLARELVKSKQQPFGNYLTLRRYERTRRTQNEIMAKSMTVLDYITKQNNMPCRYLRSISMGLLDKCTPAKKMLIHFASDGF